MEVILTTNNNLDDLEAFLKRPEIFDAAGDDLTPGADQLSLAPLLASEDVLTFAIKADETIVGAVMYVRYNSIACDIHVGFLKGFRGKLAKVAVEASLVQVFEDKGMLKIIARIPSYNKGALVLANAVGFQREGCLTESVLKDSTLHNILIYGLTKHVFFIRKRPQH